MSDFDTQIRDYARWLADTADAASNDHDARATPPSPGRPHWRRRGLMLAAAAAVVALVVGLAAVVRAPSEEIPADTPPPTPPTSSLAAVSLFPDDLEVLPIGECRTESSTQEVVATMQRNNGNTLRLFTTQASPDAPVNGHALIETNSDGQSVGGSSDCNPPGTPLESGALWVNAPSESSADGVFVWLIGQAPAPSTRVEVALSDGATVNIDLQTDGYFIGEVVRPGVETGPDASAPPFPQPTSIKAFDADGNLVQERDQ